MAKRKSWPFRNGQAISKPCKGIKMAVAVSKRPKVLKRQVTTFLLISKALQIFHMYVHQKKNNQKTFQFCLLSFVLLQCHSYQFEYFHIQEQDLTSLKIIVIEIVLKR